MTIMDFLFGERKVKSITVRTLGNTGKITYDQLNDDQKKMVARYSSSGDFAKRQGIMAELELSIAQHQLEGKPLQVDLEVNYQRGKH